ncbi:proline-rich protein PRCC-like [Crassostrea virginica]|uniref:Proline-rich protein PRCC-like n=1 Tax=Crassostrea virginica TaxID=6565 RepID=A0A8B8DUE5_CRAVI|nr:proline-rich protein PRCC-like [Crassostrea virginica]
MSLVAYGASDDSGESDVEESSSTTDDTATKKAVSTKDVPKIDNGAISDSDSDSEAKNVKSDVLNDKLRALPEPKHTNYVKGIPETDELEEEVKPKAAELADAPKPPPKKPRQPVRITVPALNPDSDEEESPSRKRAKTSNSLKGKSGLFALLPPPQHASIKETNRALIPHTLTKKQTAPPKALKKPPGTVVVGPPKPGQQDSDSDGEDQPASFFSLDSTDNTTTTLPGFSSKKLSLPPPVVASANQTENLVLGSSSSLRDSAAFGGSVQAGPVPMETSFAAGNFEHGSDETENYSVPTVPTGEEEFQQLLHSDEFLKMQGKKHRGKESINIVDVSADDFISTVDVHKSMTEEQPVRMAHKKGEGPSSQQKRKHQITYLAHQAKEREIELKNEWSQNRLTKRQTQAKYGF